MPNNNKIKGYTLENNIIKELREIGLSVERLGQANQADMIVHGFGTGEAKCKKNLKSFYDILGKNHFAVVKWQSPKARGNEPIALLPFYLFKLLLRAYVK